MQPLCIRIGLDKCGIPVSGYTTSSNTGYPASSISEFRDGIRQFFSTDPDPTGKNTDPDPAGKKYGSGSDLLLK